MTDLKKKAKAQQWAKAPIFASDLVKNPKKIMLLANEDDDTPFSLIVVPFNPDTGDTTISTHIEDPITSTAISNVILGGTPPTGYGWPLSTTSGALATTNYSLLWNAAGAVFDALEEPTGIVAARATGASSSTLVSAVSGKKYKIFAITIDVSGTAATGQVSVNEITSGAILLASDIGAAGTAGNSFSLHAGVLQPNANNGIQVTSVANATVNATLVYGAAR